MKRCPECGRDYNDDSMSFCLDDGSELLFGPASTSVGDEPATAILHSQATPDEASTRAQIHTTEQTAILPKLTEPPITISFSRKKSLIVAALGITLVAALGIGSYLYFGRGSTKQIKSIAVMPFVNESGNADVEYLSDGMTETLIGSLTQLPNLSVKARSSVFRYKGKGTDAKTLGKELNVQAILNGRVAQRGDQLTLSLELVDVTTENAIWSQQYVRKQSELVSLQSDIARDVSGKLKVKLSRTDAQRLAKNYTVDPDAYRLYLQGRYLLNEQVSEQNLTRAASFFDRAIALDPEYALAHAARAESYFLMGDLILPMSEAKRKVEPDIAKALAIDDGLVEARMLRANLEFQFDWDFARAERDFRQVLDANPNYAEAHHQFGFYLALTGKTTEALAELKLAEQLDPVNPSIQIDMHIPFYLSHQFDPSIAQARKTIEMFPGFFLARVVLGSALCLKGECSAGIQELEKAREVEPAPLVLGELGFAYAKAGRKDEARKILAQLTEMSKARYVPPWWFALIHIGLDEKNDAIALLENACDDRSWWILWIKMDPKMDSLRSDPRFLNLIRRINYPAG